MKRTSTKWTGLGLVAAICIGAAASAQADAFIALTRTGNFTAAGPVAVPLSNTGATSTGQFFNAAGRRLVVSYTAECAHDAANFGSWVDIDIRLINVVSGATFVLPPTNAAGGSDAFCTSNGTSGHDGWTMAAVHAVASGLPGGTYRVEVRARSVGGGNLWLGDSSLILWR